MGRKEEFLASAGLDLKGSLLFHGTSPESAIRIMREGFDPNADQRHGRASGEGIYLHHDPSFAAKFGPSMVIVRRGGGPLASMHDMTFGPGWKIRGPEEQMQYLKDYGHPGYKDPDDKSTIITDPSVLRPIATSHSGQCPTCFGNGFHERTGQTCPTCSGKGVMW